MVVHEGTHERAKRTPSAERRAERRSRILLGLAAALLFVGAIVFVQSRTNTGSAPTTSPRPQVVGSREPPLKNGGKLDPQARHVARTFLTAALGRQNLAEAWRLAAPELRGSVTRRQWLRGEMPFPPYPVKSLETSGFQVEASSPVKVLLQVFFVPEKSTGYEPIRYDMTLVKRHGHWIVTYLLPYAPLPVEQDSGG